MTKSSTDSSVRKHKTKKAVGRSKGYFEEDTESCVCGVCGDAVQDDPPQGRNPYFVKVTVKFGCTGSVPGSPLLHLLPFHLLIIYLSGMSELLIVGCSE